MALALALALALQIGLIPRPVFFKRFFPQGNSSIQVTIAPSSLLVLSGHAMTSSPVLHTALSFTASRPH